MRQLRSQSTTKTHDRLVLDLRHDMKGMWKEVRKSISQIQRHLRQDHILHKKVVAFVIVLDTRNGSETESFDHHGYHARHHIADQIWYDHKHSFPNELIKVGVVQKTYQLKKRSRLDAGS